MACDRASTSSARWASTVAMTRLRRSGVDTAISIPSSRLVHSRAHDRRPCSAVTEMKRVGLIVNPVAGIGGRVGLKGSDGTRVVARALALGAVPEAPARAIAALQAL